MIIDSFLAAVLWLRYLYFRQQSHPNAEFYFFAVLSDKKWQISQKELYEIATEANRSRSKNFSDILLQKINTERDLFSTPAVSLELESAYRTIQQITTAFLQGNILFWQKILSSELETFPTINAFLKGELSIQICTTELESLISMTSTSITPLSEDQVSTILTKLSLSASALQQFLNCRLAFFFQNILRLPKLTNDAAQLGILLHHTLDVLFRKMRTDHNTFPSLDWIEKQFEADFTKNKSSISKNNAAALLEKGIDLLRNFYLQNIDEWNRIAITEYRIQTSVNSIPLKGFLDKIEFKGKQICVVDYKSGRLQKGQERLEKPSEKLPYGGAYWQQAVFYKLLVENSDKDWQVETVRFDFLQQDPQSGKSPSIEWQITEAESELLWKLIQETYADIQRKDFYQGCGKPDCPYCQLAAISY